MAEIAEPENPVVPPEAVSDKQSLTENAIQCVRHLSHSYLHETENKSTQFLNELLCLCVNSRESVT